MRAELHAIAEEMVLPTHTAQLVKMEGETEQVRFVAHFVARFVADCSLHAQGFEHRKRPANLGRNRIKELYKESAVEPHPDRPKAKLIEDYARFSTDFPNFLLFFEGVSRVSDGISVGFFANRRG